MDTNATPEDRITAWLVSDAPPQAPYRLLEATFEQTRRIRRRGSPLDWRIFSMMRSIAVLTAAAVVVVALVLSAAACSIDRRAWEAHRPDGTVVDAQRTRSVGKRGVRRVRTPRRRPVRSPITRRSTATGTSTLPTATGLA